MRQLQRNVDGATAQQDAGRRDEPIISILGCGLLKCDAKSTDANYWNSAYNAEYIKPNQSSYDKGVAQSSAGFTPQQIEERNNRAGAPIAKAGAVVFGSYALAPTVAAVGTELIAFARNPVLYCTANPAACIGAVDVAAGTAAGVPLTGVPVPHTVSNTEMVGINTGLRSEIALLNASEVRLSQRTVSFSKVDRVTGEIYTYDDLVMSMRKNGWTGDPVDVVRMPDGKLTSMDNTRIVAARDAGIEVRANIRNCDQPLAAELQQARGWERYSTCGEALNARIQAQGAKFSLPNPFGSTQSPRITGRPK